MTKRSASWVAGCLVVGFSVVASADDAVVPPAPAPATAPVVATVVTAASIGTPPSPAMRPRGTAPGLAAPGDTDAVAGTAKTAASTASAPAQFATEEKWGMAGYNNNEPIYTILVTSHDTRILRCTVDLNGTYLENGEKLPITDRQTITVFPDQQVQMGNWSGMDQASGAVYSMKCRPV